MPRHPQEEDPVPPRRQVYIAQQPQTRSWKFYFLAAIGAIYLQFVLFCLFSSLVSFQSSFNSRGKIPVLFNTWAGANVLLRLSYNRLALQSLEPVFKSVNLSTKLIL